MASLVSHHEVDREEEIVEGCEVTDQGGTGKLAEGGQGQRAPPTPQMSLWLWEERGLFGQPDPMKLLSVPRLRPHEVTFLLP